MKLDIETTNFNCGVDSINEYIQESYFPSIVQQCYTYEIVSNGVVLGYYQVLFRDVKIDLFPENISDYICEIKDDTITAVHVRFLAIDKQYQNKNIGTQVLRVMIKRIEELAEQWPIRVITIDARENLVAWYKREGFKMMMSNPSGQQGITQAMYFDCIKYPEKLDEYINSMVDNYG